MFLKINNKFQKSQKILKLDFFFYAKLKIELNFHRDPQRDLVFFYGI